MSIVHIFPYSNLYSCVCALKMINNRSTYSM